MTCFALIHFVLAFVSPLLAQPVGTVTPLSLSSGSGNATLDLANNDYEIFLYSAVTDAVDSTRTFAYSISTGTAPALSHAPTNPARSPSLRNPYESVLRQKERLFAHRIQTEGWSPAKPKIATLQQVGFTRVFAFDKFGGVTANKTVTATMVASNARAIAYVDNELPASGKNISTSQIEAMLNTFSNSTFVTITDIYGNPSDVDGDNKVLFLYTPLVDQVGGVAGFYASGSLFTIAQGGDGNVADMMFISPTRDPAFYTSLLAHEFQHLINFNEHVLVRKGDAEETWLNEGLSHVAEDLVNGHIDGGNTDLVSEFMSAPERYALTGDASLNLGIRGAAYLFVRGMMESFGADVPGRLVKTNKVHIANVEALSGQPFDDVYRSFSSRLFLSGNGLSGDPAQNYSYTYFSEPKTGWRSMPLPREQKLSDGTTHISGAVRPAASSYVRLTGSASRTLTVQTDPTGNFRAFAVALPKNFSPLLALPVDFFQNITLDEPLSAVVTAGASVSFAGRVNDATLTQILLTYEPRDPSGEEIRFSVAVTAGRFSQSVLFAPSQAGEYTLAVFAGEHGNQLPQVGRFPGAIVSAGSGTVSLPVDFFTGITLRSALPGQYRAGEGISLAGQVTDASFEVLLLVFTNKTDSSTLRVQTSVSGGAFRKGFVFTPGQAGSYSLDLYGGRAGGSLGHLGGFSPVVVTSTGNESVYLPVDLFDGVVLGSPMNATFVAGLSRRISGTVANPDITQVAISFSPVSGGPSLDSFVDVVGGQLSTDASSDIAFTAAQAGEYEIVLYGGLAGQSLPFLGRFSPISVLSPRPVLTLATSALTWSDVPEGSSASQTLTLGNDGSQTLTITGLIAEAPFSVSQKTLSIAPCGTGKAEIVFAPTSGGSHAGTLQVLSDDPVQGTRLVSLTGSAIAVDRPAITLRQTSLAWAAVVVGQTESLPLTWINTGRTDLTVILRSSDKVFTFSDSTRTVAPGDSTIIQARFSPTATGETTGTLTLVTNDPANGNLTLALSGTGVVTLTPTPTADFDGNGTVGFSDFLAFAAAFGSSAGSPAFSSKFDLDSDGRVGFSDFLTFASAFGKPA